MSFRITRAELEQTAEHLSVTAIHDIDALALDAVQVEPGERRTPPWKTAEANASLASAPWKGLVPGRPESLGDHGEATTGVATAGDRVGQPLLAVEEHKRVGAVGKGQEGRHEHACVVNHPGDSTNVRQRSSIDGKRTAVGAAYGDGLVRVRPIGVCAGHSRHREQDHRRNSDSKKSESHH